MSVQKVYGTIFLGAVLLVIQLYAAETKVDLSKEQVGKPPATFEPVVGTWSSYKMGVTKLLW